MAAGAAGRDENFAPRVQPAGERRKSIGCEGLAVEIEGQGAEDGVGLLVNLAQHGMRKFDHVYLEERTRRGTRLPDFIGLNEIEMK